MKIHSAEFEISAFRKSQFPKPDVPEIVFMGRSNVGKSSLLNMLTGAKKLAHTSQTPGKTQSINFYRVNEKVRFVDLPGYGFARASVAARKKWAALIESYLAEDRPVAVALLLMDARHPLQKNDAQLLEWLIRYQVPLQIVLTKADKLNRSERDRILRELPAALEEHFYRNPLLFISSANKEGKIDLLKRLDVYLMEYDGLAN